MQFPGVVHSESTRAFSCSILDLVTQEQR